MSEHCTLCGRNTRIAVCDDREGCPEKARALAAAPPPPVPAQGESGEVERKELEELDRLARKASESPKAIYRDDEIVGVDDPEIEFADALVNAYRKGLLAPVPVQGESAGVDLMEREAAGFSVEKAYRDRIKELEARIAELEGRSHD